MNVKLASTLKLRSTEFADVNAVAKLIYDVCEADGDVTVAVTPEELERQWHNKDFNPEMDTYVVETDDKHIIGYGEFINEKDHAHLGIDVYVHHQCERAGILAALISRLEERAREDMNLICECSFAVPWMARMKMRKRRMKPKAILSSAITGAWKLNWMHCLPHLSGLMALNCVRS
jgi:GNAT superfamily N-acetyltransferase